MKNGLIIIDIDSFDSYIFSKIGLLEPAICIVEYNNSIPPWINYQDLEGEIFLRCSLKGFNRIGKEQGYNLVVATTTNAIFLRKELCAKHNIITCEPEESYLYEEQAKNHSMFGTTVASYMMTSYPVFVNCVQML